MSLTLFSVTLLFVLWLFVLRCYLRSCMQSTNNKHVYLDVISTLRSLFEHLPQHRGLANAYLQGDASFKDKLVQTQLQIDADIEKVQAALNFEDENPLAYRWQEIQNEWVALKSQISSLEPPQSFQLHTNLITEVIYMIDDCASRLNVCDGDKTQVSKLNYIVFNQLPLLMECVGRARGIGTGAATVQKVSVANRVKLGFLHGRIDEAIYKCQVGFSEIFMLQPALAVKKPLVEESQRLTGNFVSVLKYDLLESDKVEIKPSDYYDAGTAAISKNLMLFDSLMPLIIEHAEAAQGKVASRFKILGVGALLGIVLLAWSWVAFA